MGFTKIGEMLQGARFRGGGSLGVSERPSGRVLFDHGVSTPDARRMDDGGSPALYDVVSVGGYSMTVEGASVPGYPGVEIVEDYYGEDFPVVDSGLTRQEIEDGEWCWGRGVAPDAQTHFSLVITQHGNRRTSWHRLPIDDPDWWHGDKYVPRNQIYGRSIGENATGGLVCLTLKFGVFEG